MDAGRRDVVVGANPLVVRAPALSERVKYWIKPDLENRIRSGAIQAHFSATVAEITPEAARVCSLAGSGEILATAAVVEDCPTDVIATSLGKRALRGLPNAIVVFLVGEP